MTSRIFSTPTTISAAEVFTAAVWVLRALAIVGTLFIAAVSASWVS